MNFLRSVFMFGLVCAPSLGITGDFFGDCRMQIALRATPIKITVVAEKYADSLKKNELIQEAYANRVYLGMEGIPFGRKGGSTFSVKNGTLRVEVDPAGPVFGLEDADMTQVQDMALALMHWDVYLSQRVFEWDEEKVMSVVKFVIATQYDGGRWLLIQKRHRFVTGSFISELRKYGSIPEIIAAMQEGIIPHPDEFAEMLRAWGAVANSSLVSTTPEQWPQLGVVSKFFSERTERYDPVEVQTAIEQVRHSLIAMNLARFVVSKLDAPRHFYLVLSPKHAEKVANILKANLDGVGVTVNLSR